jgi:hypothetical protein
MSCKQPRACCLSRLIRAGVAGTPAVGADVNSVWERRKLAARKMLEKPQSTPVSSVLARLLFLTYAAFNHRILRGFLCQQVWP